MKILTRSNEIYVKSALIFLALCSAIALIACGVLIAGPAFISMRFQVNMLIANTRSFNKNYELYQLLITADKVLSVKRALWEFFTASRVERCQPLKGRVEVQIWGLSNWTALIIYFCMVTSILYCKSLGLLVR